VHVAEQARGDLHRMHLVEGALARPGLGLVGVERQHGSRYGQQCTLQQRGD
jgi:hypothetical protein